MTKHFSSRRLPGALAGLPTAPLSPPGGFPGVSETFGHKIGGVGDPRRARCPRRTRHAFTLVEMLTVIIIIGILASLMLVAFGAARRSARNAAVKMEVTQLDMAIERYRTEYGDYPPDFVGTAPGYADAVRIPARTAVIRHLRRRFPRLQIPSGTPDQQFNAFVVAVAAATSDNNQNGQGLCAGQPAEAGDGPGIDISAMTPAQALVFWLGGLPAYAGSNELTGLSANPANPFAARTIVNSRVQPLFDFTVAQLFRPGAVDIAPLAYGRLDAAAVIQPYLYFRPVGSPFGSTNSANANFNWYLGALLAVPAPVAARGFCAPIFTVPPAVSPALPYVGATGWENAPTAQDIRPQIIWSGLDGDYGQMGDNIVNFTQATTIRDEYGD